jgi:hypothetical protein
MTSRVSRRTPLWVLVLAASFVAYFVLLMYCELARTEDPGFEADFGVRGMSVGAVAANSPAARAGIITGDVVLSADGRRMASVADWRVVDANIVHGRPIPLELARSGVATRAMLVLGAGARSYWITWAGVLLLIARGVQAVALALAILIVVRRPDDIAARLGAWVLASVAVFDLVLPQSIAVIWRGLPAPIGWLLWIPHVSADYALGAILFTFLASFPRPLIRSRAWWFAVWTPMVLILGTALGRAIATVYAPQSVGPAGREGIWLTVAAAVYAGAGLVALTANYRTLTSTDRRKVRVLLFGTCCGLGPGVLLIGYFWLRSSADLSASVLASPITSIGTIALISFPVSFAYAVLQHRLFDLGTIVRRGVQYALARRFLQSLMPGLVLVLLVDLLTHRKEPLLSTIASRGWVYVSIAALAAVAYSQRQKWLDVLDRTFFREHYNAQRVLRSVADDVRAGTDLTASAPGVIARIDTALHPTFTALLVRDVADETYRIVAAQPRDLELPPLPWPNRLTRLLRALDNSLDLTAARSALLLQDIGPQELAFVERGGVELLVPVALQEGGFECFLSLGPKRSEEPYAREDRDLLAVVAASLGHALHGPRQNAADERTGPPLVIADRYRIERQIGRGGMGTVHAALDLLLQRWVAVKVLRDDVMSMPEATARFQREARAAAAFSHPNVVTVHDVGVSAGHPFLVMELLDGPTLRDVLRQEHRLDPERAIRILRDVASAVQAAHQRGLVHRDLKPENVALVDHEGRETAKVLDFGLARAVRSDPGELQLTGGALLGTPLYMSPEQLRGEPVDASWDLWSFAIVAFEMLTGSHPFAGVGVHPVSRMDQSESQSPHMPPACHAVFRDALSIDAGRRPASAVLLVAELERSLRA